MRCARIDFEVMLALGADVEVGLEFGLYRASGGSRDTEPNCIRLQRDS
jgi:hypothetical protein